MADKDLAKVLDPNECKKREREEETSKPRKKVKGHRGAFGRRPGSQHLKVGGLNLSKACLYPKQGLRRRLRGISNNTHVRIRDPV